MGPGRRESYMNSATKQTLVAMATAALSMTGACKSDAGPSATEATTGTEKAVHEGAMEASCGEGSCGDAMKKKGDHSEASCGEGSCGEGSCG